MERQQSRKHGLVINKVEDSKYILKKIINNLSSVIGQ